MTQRSVLLQALASTPRDIERLIRAMPTDGHDWQPGGEANSARQVLAHLLEAEMAYRHRLKRIREEDNPALPQFDPEAAKAAPTPEESAQALVASFTESRQTTLHFLTELSPGEWQRSASGARPARTTTLRYQVMDLMNHDVAHLGELVDIRVKWDSR